VALHCRLARSLFIPHPPRHAGLSGAAAQAADDGAPLQGVQGAAGAQALAGSVAAAKAQVQAALANVPDAFQSYLRQQTGAIASASRSGARLPPALSVLAAEAGSPEALQRRQAVFADNLQRLVKANEDAGPNAGLGMNSFLHLTKSEFRAMYTSRFPAGEKKRGPSAACLERCLVASGAQNPTHD
jgi:hypothetical protein